MEHQTLQTDWPDSVYTTPCSTHKPSIIYTPWWNRIGPLPISTWNVADPLYRKNSAVHNIANILWKSSSHTRSSWHNKFVLQQHRASFVNSGKCNSSFCRWQKTQVTTSVQESVPGSQHWLRLLLRALVVADVIARYADSVPLVWRKRDSVENTPVTTQTPRH